ncbi:hypothetical protein BROC_00155 [Candidatus Brocadiaceae bacterium]|nr:hypothetical protein BROC_00155 [Candidatus Brocadiaceae bacterium]
MKKLMIILLALCFTALIGCGKGQQINGHNMKTAYRSVKGLKKYMPAEKQMEFEISFGLLHDANKDESAFLEVVDGKKPEQIIELAKAQFEERKKQGAKELEQYASWEDMINKFDKERTDQDKVRKNKDTEDKHKEDASILYNPRFPNKSGR